MKQSLQAWSAKQPWHLGYQHVANLNGIKYYTAIARAVRLGAKVTKMKPGRKTGTRNNPALLSRKIPYGEQLDWSRSDRSLATQYGVSKQRINQLRFAAGAPQYKPFRTQEA